MLNLVGNGSESGVDGGVELGLLPAAMAAGVLWARVTEGGE
jgi:hypothetical protein